MIFDPDLPREQRRTDRQSLICTERGWAVMGQPTASAEAWINSARGEMAALFPDKPDGWADRFASELAVDLVGKGAL